MEKKKDVKLLIHGAGHRLPKKLVMVQRAGPDRRLASARRDGAMDWTCSKHSRHHWRPAEKSCCTSPALSILIQISIQEEAFRWICRIMVPLCLTFTLMDQARWKLQDLEFYGSGECVVYELGTNAIAILAGCQGWRTKKKSSFNIIYSNLFKCSNLKQF